MKNMLDISGPQMRKLLSILSLYVGIVYITFNVSQTSEISSTFVSRNSMFLPYWLYGIVFIILGIIMYKTINIRLCKAGRIIAAIGMAVYLFCWIANVMLNLQSMQVFYYPIISLFYLIEALSAK